MRGSTKRSRQLDEVDLMTKAWPQQFNDWMLTKGVIRGKRPRDPMSKNSARSRLFTVKKMAGDLGYIGKGAKSLRDIRPKELADWMEKEFPDGGWDNPTTWNYYVWGVYKLSEYIFYEITDWRGNPVWAKDDLKWIKEEVALRPLDNEEPPKLSKDFIRRYEEFMEWMKRENPFVYAFARWSYLTTMRFDEVARMNVGLKTGSAIQKPDGTLEVAGKRDRGKRVPRPVPVGNIAKDHLKWWMRFRKSHDIDAEPLFVTTRGHGRWRDSANYNRQLRRLARKSRMFKGTCDDKGDHPTDELVLIRSHWMGRHAGATALGYKKADIMLIKRQTGHKRIDILDGRYLNLDPKEVAIQLDEYRNGNGSSPDRVVKVDISDLFRQLMELPDDEREQLGLMLLRGHSA